MGRSSFTTLRRSSSFDIQFFSTNHLCWAVLTWLAFSAPARYPLSDDSWSDRQDQRAIPVGAPCHRTTLQVLLEAQLVHRLELACAKLKPPAGSDLANAHR